MLMTRSASTAPPRSSLPGWSDGAVTSGAAAVRVRPLRVVLLLTVALLLAAGSAGLLVSSVSHPLGASSGAAALDVLLGRLAAGAAGIVGVWWTLGLLACGVTTLRRVSPSSVVARVAGSLPRPLQVAAGATLGVALTAGAVPAALAEPGTTSAAVQLVASAEPEWLPTGSGSPSTARTSPAAIEGPQSRATVREAGPTSPAAVEGAARGAPLPHLRGGVETRTDGAARSDVLEARANVDPAWAPVRPAAPPRVSSAPEALLPALRHETTTVDQVVVHRGDNLWDITARYLGEGATDSEIAVEWPRWYEANRDVLGDDPDHIEPGQLLVPPPAADGPGA